MGAFRGEGTGRYHVWLNAQLLHILANCGFKLILTARRPQMPIFRIAVCRIGRDLHIQCGDLQTCRVVYTCFVVVHVCCMVVHVSSMHAEQ